MVDTRSEFDELARLYLPVAIAVAAIVIAAILFTLVRFRRRDDELPPQRDGAPRLELLYAVGLAAVVVVLLTMTFKTQARVDALSARPGLNVDVTAAKWTWRFQYPGSRIDVVTQDTRLTDLVVPSDTTVRFSLTSLDVVHAFWCPETRFKRDVFPRRTTQFDLVFDKPGLYTCHCAEFCGLKHGQMRFSVEVLTPGAFDAWRADTEGRAA